MDFDLLYIKVCHTDELRNQKAAPAQPPNPKDKGLVKNPAKSNMLKLCFGTRTKQTKSYFNRLLHKIHTYTEKNPDQQ